MPKNVADIKQINTCICFASGSRWERSAVNLYINYKSVDINNKFCDLLFAQTNSLPSFFPFSSGKTYQQLEQ